MDDKAYIKMNKVMLLLWIACKPKAYTNSKMIFISNALFAISYSHNLKMVKRNNNKMSSVFSKFMIGM